MAQEGPTGQAPVAAAVVVAGGRVLLVRRAANEGGQWQLPGGEIQPGESDEDAAERETLEEAGVSVNAVGRLGNRVHPVTGRTVVYVACRVADENTGGDTGGDTGADAVAAADGAAGPTAPGDGAAGPTGADAVAAADGAAGPTPPGAGDAAREPRTAGATAEPASNDEIAEVGWCDRTMLAERLSTPLFEPVAAYLDEHML